MADVNVKIVYPKDSRAASAGRLYAFGTVDPSDATIAGNLTPHDGSAVIAGTLLPRAQVPPAYDWGMFFDGVRPKTIQRLRVTGTKAGFNPDAAVVHFHASHPPAFGPALAVDHPASGATLPGNFVVMGYVDPDSSVVSAWLQQFGQGDPANQGMPIRPVPSPYDWALQFAFVNPGNYVLIVQAVGGGGTTNVPLSITVT